MPLISINPATEEVIGRYNEISAKAAAAAVDAAHEAYLAWRDLSFDARAGRFMRLAELLRERAKECAALITAEMGKPIQAATGEVEKCATACEHFARHAEAYLQPEMVHTDARKSYIAYRPLGAMLAIMPWNFPFWQVLRFAAPALMAGNTCVLKHANNVTGVALKLEQLFADADFPPGVFRTLLIEVPGIDALIRHPRIASVSLTGSTRAGRAVASSAGAALKRCVLELGGSDPFIVLDDADLDLAVREGSTGRLQANGQSCIAAKRFIVVQSRAADFEERFKAHFEAVRMGDPMDPQIDLGPLARQDLREGLDRQVRESIDRGARLVCGGVIPVGKGWYYPATILADVAPGMPGFDQELFGPVAAIVRAKNEADAIRLANASNYGLGAVVCSEDRDRAEGIARDLLEAGSCFVNAYTRSDPRLPFGGVKESGHGRELGANGIRELCNVKTVYIA